jgi:Zn-dependent M28 family amino/carboxypeptidase
MVTRKTIPNRKRITLINTGILLLFGAFLVAALLVLGDRMLPRGSTTPYFDEQRAFGDIEYQLSLGPRTIGSEAHTNTIDYIQDELRDEGWKVEVQEFNEEGCTIQNVIAKMGKGTPWIILGAHYDSRFFADQDPNPENRQLPVPGANDGASGVAVLLEIGRALPSRLDRQIWLVFFDAEDNGDLKGWDWIMGSRAFVANLDGKPDAVVIVDMIGDASQQIYMEAFSNKAMKEEIWQQAADLGYNQFYPRVKYSMTDDHTPFLQAGIPAVDIIDFDYSYWHTTNDTVDKVSAASLDAVGETVLAWLLKYGK